MKTLRIIGKNIHLNMGEKEWLRIMMNEFKCTEQQALEEIITYKREMAFSSEQKGNWELARQLLQEIDEWDDTRESDYKQIVESEKKITIILPNDIK